MQEGWMCPVCGRGLAPWVAVCPCYEEGHKTLSMSGTLKVEYPNSIDPSKLGSTEHP